MQEKFPLMQPLLQLISQGAPADVDAVVMKVKMGAWLLVSAAPAQVNWAPAGFEAVHVLNCLGRWKPARTSTATSNYPEEYHSIGIIHPLAAGPTDHFGSTQPFLVANALRAHPLLRREFHPPFGFASNTPTLTDLTRTTKSFSLSEAGLEPFSPSNPPASDLFHSFNMKDKRNRD